MSADDGQTKSFVLIPPHHHPPPSFPSSPGSEDVPPSHKAAFIPSTTTTSSTSTTTSTISDTKQHSWVSMRSALWWSLHRYWKSPNAKTFTDRPTTLMIWSWRHCRGKSLIESRATVITSNQSYGWRFLLGLNGMQMARYKKNKIGHHLYMTRFSQANTKHEWLDKWEGAPVFNPKDWGHHSDWVTKTRYLSCDAYNKTGWICPIMDKARHKKDHKPMNGVSCF